ncbi:hypothetical protein L7F22_040788 [Adiantum nelumboides]|nr:hypothetical protein [Adiantum nelumboides]
MGDIEHNLGNDSGTIQTPLLESSPTHHEGCPGCWLDERKARTPDALPYKDLSIIGLLCLCNSLPISSLFAYVYYMVQDLGIAKSTTQIGTYVGFLGSSLLLGRFMSSTVWGFVADRYGHKPVMYIGTASTFIFMTVFGFSTNYWIAILSRFLTGLANGITATIRAYAAEVCSTEHQAFSMSIVGTMWGVGLIIGPAIGGYLAQPSEKLPLIFPNGSLFDLFPYALPSLCISALALAGFIMCFWLPESLHTHNTSVKKVSEGFSSIEKNSNGQSEAKEDDKQISKGEVQGGQRQLWKNRGFIAAVSLNAVWVVHGMSYAEIFPLWACSPKMYGGIAFTTSEVANVLALSGTSMLLFQLFFFSPLIRAFGTIECLRAFMFLTVPLTAIYPLIARFHGIVLWILLVLVSAGKNVLSDFTVGARRVGVAVDHALLSFFVSFQYIIAQTSGGISYTPYTFTPKTDSVYLEEIYSRLCTVGPGLSVEECTTLLTKTLHGAALEAYPHTQPGQRQHSGSMPQNSWYDEECRERRAQLQRDLLLEVITYRQSRIASRRLVRRKKRAYLAQLERNLYDLFLSRDLGEAWRFFHEHSPPPVITSPDVWGQYATALYTVPIQVRLPDPIEPCPPTSSFFTTAMVKRAIDRMRTGRAYDHDGLVAEHFIHARDTLVEVLAVLFNRAMCEGLLEI